MEKEIKDYQCSGCINDNENCFSQRDNTLACENHTPGTFILGIGAILLGLPKGFNRINTDKTKVYIFKDFQDGWGYDKFNIPVWKYLNENNHTIVRGMSPRLNRPWIHIFLCDCRNDIDCLEITNEDLDEMD